MIERLLNEIRSGGPSTPATLAKKLNTSPEMITAMLEKLAQFGLIENFSPGCSDSSCQGCSIDSYCQKPTRTPGQIWSVKKPQTP